MKVVLKLLIHPCQTSNIYPGQMSILNIHVTDKKCNLLCVNQMTQYLIVPLDVTSSSRDQTLVCGAVPPPVKTLSWLRKWITLFTRYQRSVWLGLSETFNFQKVNNCSTLVLTDKYWGILGLSLSLYLI